MAVLEWIKANPTKLTGWLTTVVATVQMSSARTIIFSDAGFEIFVLGIGLFVSFIGMFNTGQATAEAAAKKVEAVVAEHSGAQP